MQKIIKKLNSPDKVQKFIDGLNYNKSKRISALDVMRLKKADCLEAAVLASMVLSFHKIPNFIMDFTAERDEDHVICVFKQKGRFGAIAMSKFMGLRYRNPVYSSIRELSMSYFESYFNFRGELTLRGHGMPVKFKPTEENMSSAKFMRELEKKLDKGKHVTLVKKVKLRVTKLRFERDIVVRK